jgi:uncharacterized RDD family membrane protein YckC
MLRHEVVTTEKVPFTYRVAGMGSRFLAWLVDALIWVGLAGIGVGLMTALEIGRGGVGAAVLFVWMFVLRWGYFLTFEWLWQGQTPGKRLVGIRVIDWGGTAVSFEQSAVRNIVRLVDGLPFYGVGFVVAAGNRQHRRLGDLAAGTLVVHVERGARPVTALAEPRTEADRARLALLRQRLDRLDREQKQALLDLCLRREQLRVAERARLFRAAAQFVQGRLDLAPGEYESDEKFVVQLAGVLGERRGGESPSQ